MDLLQVGLTVVVELFCPLVEARNTIVSTHPNASVSILLERKNLAFGNALFATIACDVQGRRIFGYAIQTDQTFVGGHPKRLSVEIADSLVYLERNRTFGRNQIITGIGELIVDAGSIAQGRKQQTMVIEGKETCNGNRQETGNGWTRLYDALIVSIDSCLSTHPDAME